MDTCCAVIRDPLSRYTHGDCVAQLRARLPYDGVANFDWSTHGHNIKSDLSLLNTNLRFLTQKKLRHCKVQADLYKDKGKVVMLMYCIGFK